MSAPALRWHVCGDGDALTRMVRAAVAAHAARAIGVRGTFSIVLAGGATPRRLYADLAALEDAAWARWHVYFGDERCLPRDDPDRNDSMARNVWLDRVTIPPAQIHAIEAERGADAAARAYRAELSGVGRFDLVLLGLGEDGHTASLFPGQPLGAEAGAPVALAVHHAPKPPAERVSLSAARLARAGAVFVLVTGRAKREAVRALGAGATTPLGAIRPANGIDIYLDREAAGRTSRP